MRLACAQAAGVEEQQRDAFCDAETLRATHEQPQDIEQAAQQAFCQAQADRLAALTGDLDAQRRLLKQALGELDRQREEASRAAAA